MTTDSKFRLLIDPPTNGVRNMAVDEALLAAAHEPSSLPVLRWYRWSEPTLSLGYFQRWNDVPDDLQSLPRVRRSTGGGAILHTDDEITYSLTLGPGTWPRTRALDVVSDFHAAVASVMDPVFVLYASDVVRLDSTVEPFMCFDRRSPSDLVVGDDKIMGSAQRRQGGCLLQHGSINAVGLDSCKLIERATKELSSRWEVEFSPSQLTADETTLAVELAVKHRSMNWTRRR